MTDFLLEFRSEEIPARMQDDARQNLKRLFATELEKWALPVDDIATYATPRRLALIAYGLPEHTQPVREETKGPKADAPTQAIEGFLRKTGLSRGQIEERDGVLFAVKDVPGFATRDVLKDVVFAVVHGFPWPKSMRWGAHSKTMTSLRWVRPLQGMVALFGDEIVPCEIDGLVAGRDTVGHRFHSQGSIEIPRADADCYEAELRKAKVVVDQEGRRRIIREGAFSAAVEAGLTLIQDPHLINENAGLTEWPVPLLGRFDEAFLAVPPEVIQLTARVNQKYFVCRDGAGKLANAFVCTANIDAADGGAAIVEGNRKVLAARLSDARFFYETDLKVPLEEQAKKLEKIVFHEKLGTVADKVERVAKLARWLVEEGIVTSSPLPVGEGQGASAPRGEGRGEPVDAALTLPLGSAERAPPSPKGRGDLAALAERAARLCKADLVTGMVGEFPELQGVMGGYYAAAQGEDPAVAAAIRDHYKPVGQGDDVPTAPVTVAVSLADKLDTLLSFYTIGEVPTGSKDPFALRRAALGSIALVLTNGLRIPLLALFMPMFQERVAAFGQPFMGNTPNGVLSLIADRLKVQQREAGVRHDLIDAVFALGGEDDLVRLLARVRALQAFVGTEDGANLLAGYKRAANILKKEGFAPLPLAGGAGGGPVDASDAPADTPSPNPSRKREGEFSLSHAPESAETALIAALDVAEPAAASAVQAEDFEAAMAALASLRAPIDAFFDNVTVNDPDPEKRAARLALLARVRDAVHGVADFSKIEG